MGQQTSLNCRSSAKQVQPQIQTTQPNVIHTIKTRNARSEGEQSEIRWKKSATTNMDNSSSIALSTASHPSNAPPPQKQTIYLQHENILKVAATPFPNSEKVGKVFSEKPGKSLAEIVQSRYNTTMHFPHPQAVILVESLVYSLRFMQLQGLTHHDYYPTNIHYHVGMFKVANPVMVTVSAYSLTQQRKRFSFLSPELIRELLQDTQQADIPEEVMYKSDIFAIGMMALQFCTLQPSSECYDEQNYSLVDKVIQERLVKVAKLYSANIADCIAEMLRYEVEERIGEEELSLLVFLNAAAEKAEPQGRPQAQATGQPHGQIPQKVQQTQVPPPVPQRLYQPNPPYVQQQFLILPPGAQPPPGQQILPLGQNSIGLPTPNYAYTRIGPNNQGLLSPTTLTNKLKVIQLIHEKPQEQEQSDGQMSSLPSHMLPTLSNQPSHHHQQRGSEPRMHYAVPQQQVHYTNQGQSFQRESKPDPRPESKIQEKQYQMPSREFTRPPIPQKTQQQSRSGRPYPPSSNIYLAKTDQNGETLQQRVQRILLMSRSIQ